VHYLSRNARQSLIAVVTTDRQAILGDGAKINMPREKFSELRRVDSISRYASSVLAIYDVVVYPDCDEPLVPLEMIWTSRTRYFLLREIFPRKLNDDPHVTSEFYTPRSEIGAAMSNLLDTPESDPSGFGKSRGESAS